MFPRYLYPDVPLDYIFVLKTAFGNYRSIKSYGDFEKLVGPEKIIDATNMPGFKDMLDVGPRLPAGFHEKVFIFITEKGYKGNIDVVFEDTTLVNFRAQVHFKGFAAKRKAKNYLISALFPNFLRLFGKPTNLDPDSLSFDFQLGDIKGAIRFGDKLPWVSFYLMDERYA